MSDEKVLLTYKRKRVSATSSLPHEDGPHYPHSKKLSITLLRTSDKSQDSNINDASVEQVCDLTDTNISFATMSYFWKHSVMLCTPTSPESAILVLS